MSKRPAAPRCAHCDKPATCFGSYEDSVSWGYACDECCGHGCEDGQCFPIAEIGVEFQKQAVALEKMDEDLLATTERAEQAERERDEARALCVAETMFEGALLSESERATVEAWPKPATFSAVVERAILEVYEAGRESAGIAAPLPEPVKVAGAWHNVGGYQLQMRCPCCEQPIAEISYGPFDHPCRYTIASKRGAPATQHTANSADEAKASVGVALRAAGWTLRDGTEKP